MIKFNLINCLLGVLLFMASFLGTSCTSGESEQFPVAKDGIIDLTNWDFDNGGLIVLNGEWEFYWNQLLEPANFENGATASDKRLIQVPMIWNKQEYKDGNYPGPGYATYRLLIRIKKRDKAFAIKIRYVETAYKLWVNNRFLLKNGEVSVDKENAVPEFKSLFSPINLNDLEAFSTDSDDYVTLQVLMQVSNYHHVKSGILEPIHFGDLMEISNYRSQRLAEVYIISGIILIMGLYHLLLFSLRRKEKSTLYFGLLCLLMVLRTISCDERVIMDWIPNLNWELLSKIEYISGYTTVTLMGLFFYFIFRNEFPKIAMRIMLVVGLLILATILVFPIIVYTKVKVVFMIYMLLGGLYCILWVLPKSIINKRQGAVLALIGLLAMYGTGINDLLRSMGVIHTLYVTSYGLVVYIFSQSYLLSRRFSTAFTTVEVMTEDLKQKNIELYNYQNHLEQLVHERTAEVVQQKEEIQAQAEQLSEANKELEKLSIVASETDNSILIADKEGNIEWVNNSFTRLFGYTLEEFKEQVGDTIFNASSNKDIEEAYELCINSKQPVTYSLPTENKNGGKIWVQTTLTPVIDENGELWKLVAIDSDISEIKLAQEEIHQQNEEIMAQSELLMSSNELLEKKNQLITDSINYAKKIQDALLPPIRVIKEHIPDSFVIFKPKDIVSGDFFWFSKQEDKIFIAEVDCTGHGVPGGFMSMIGSSLLNQVVVEKKIYKPSEILDLLNKSIVKALNQHNSLDSTDDGMDVSICRIDLKNKEIQVACANQEVYYFQDGLLNIINGDHYSVGDPMVGKNDFSYINHTISIEKETTLYMMSDGYQDQFGGPKFKKFMVKNMREMIVDIHNEKISSQREILETRFDEWKGNNRQIDDVLVVGLKV